MTSRYTYFLQILHHQIFIINMRCCQSCKSDHSIHWRADIVWNTVQEICLRFVGMFCCCQCISQLPLLLQFFLFFFRDIPVCQQHCPDIPVTVKTLRYDHGKKPCALFHLACISQWLLSIQPLCHGVHVNKFQKTFPILRCQHLIYMILLNLFG